MPGSMKDAKTGPPGVRHPIDRRSQVICYATISPISPRYPTWLEVFGTDTIPLESDRSVVGTVPGLQGPHRFFYADLRELGDTACDDLFCYVNARFRRAGAGEYKPVRRCPI